MKRKINILITGGSGLLGRELIYLLKNKLPEAIIVTTYFKHKPAVYGKNIIWKRCDLTNIKNGIFDDFIFNKVIHTAAFLTPAGKNPDDFAKPIFSTNVLGTINLFNSIALSKDAHIVYISSAAVYKEREGSKFKENDKLFPPHVCGVYGHSKIYCEWYLSKLFNKRLTIIRPSGIYGKYMQEDKLLPRLLIQAVKNEVLTISPPFDTRFDYIHVKDVSYGIYQTLLKHAIGIYNLGSGSGITIKKLAETCIDAAKKGKLPGIVTINNKKIPFITKQQLLVDITRSKDRLKWRPKIKLKDGLRGLIPWLIKEGMHEK